METVAVLGAGTMGRGIAQVVAQAEHQVIVYDPHPEALEHAKTALREVLGMLEGKGRLVAADVMRRIAFTAHLGDLQGADWVIEAAPEDLAIKRALFAELDTSATQAVLATNTSTLSVGAIASATARPQDVIGLHFFNPAPLMKLVEVVPTGETRGDIVTRAVAFVRGLGKTPVVVKDAPGFIVNRVARPFYGEALKLHGEGVPFEAIDLIVRGLGFRMGPFELMDLIGMDINLAATRGVYEASFYDPRYRPHRIQQAMVEAGRLGKKRGRGFYHYPREEAPLTRPHHHMESAPCAYMLGAGMLVDEFKKHFRYTRDTARADLVIDLRVDLTQKSLPEGVRGLPVATFVWGHSASLAVARYHGASAVAGVSLVPPLTDKTVVELYAPLSGENAAVASARHYFEAHGLPVVALADTPGGVAFRILATLINEAVSALAEGLASADAINDAMRLGTNYPLGPLAWSELLRPANVLAGLSGLHDELGDSRYRPEPLLKRMVALSMTSWSSVTQGAS